MYTINFRIHTTFTRDNFLARTRRVLNVYYYGSTTQYHKVMLLTFNDYKIKSSIVCNPNVSLFIIYFNKIKYSKIYVHH